MSIKVNYVEGGVDNLRYYCSGGKYWIIDDDHPFALIVIDAKGINKVGDVEKIALDTQKYANDYALLPASDLRMRN